MSRVVGIDFGLKRIGVAVSDERRTVALPLGTAEGGKNGVKNVIALLADRKVVAVVVGLPITLKGERGVMVKLVEEFGTALGQALDTPVIYVDERLSSAAADRSLMEISLNRKARSERIDMATATMMLQSFLDQHKNDSFESSRKQ